MNMHQFPHVHDDYAYHTLPNGAEFYTLIAHSKVKLLMCSEYFISSQISFYAIFCGNPKTEPGSKIWFFFIPGRTSDPPRATMGDMVGSIYIFATKNLRFEYNFLGLPCFEGISTPCERGMSVARQAYQVICNTSDTLIRYQNMKSWLRVESYLFISSSIFAQHAITCHVFVQNTRPFVCLH